MDTISKPAMRNTAHALSLPRILLVLIQREGRLALRTPQHTLTPLAFFVMVTALFPLGITPDPTTLANIAGGILWIGALLAVLLSLNTLFKDDYADGSLDQLLLSPYPLPWLVLAKVFSHWATTGLCLTLLAPLLACMLHLSEHAMAPLVYSLLLGTPVLSLVGAIGAALTLPLQQGGILITLLTLPLYLPVLIFATDAIKAAAQGLPCTGQLLWLSVLLISGLCLAPLAIAGVLRAVND